MWSLRRKNKDQKKLKENRIVLPVEKGMIQLPLPRVRFDGDKCIILINGKEEILDDGGLIIEVKADNARPIKIKIFPDFKNRKLNAVEIIDVDDNKEYPKDGPQLKFVGLGNFNRDDIKNRIDILDQFINKFDEDMLRQNKKTRRNSYISITILSIILSIQTYFAYTEIGLIRNINILMIIIGICIMLLNIIVIKKANKLDKEIKNRHDSSNKLEWNKAEIVKEK